MVGQSLHYLATYFQCDPGLCNIVGWHPDGTGPHLNLDSISKNFKKQRVGGGGAGMGNETA